MDWVEWLAMLVLVAVVVPPAIAPISVRRQVWKARQPRFDRLPSVSLPEGVARQVTPQADRLQALGFDLVGYAVRTDQCGGAITHLALLVDRAEGHLAAVESVALGEVRRTYVEFCSELADSVELNTSNGDGVGCEPSHPGARSYAFPSLQDLERLYRLHRGLVQQAAHGRPSRRPAAGAEFDELVRGMEREKRPPGVVRLLVSGRQRRPVSTDLEGGGPDDLEAHLAGRHAASPPAPPPGSRAAPPARGLTVHAYREGQRWSYRTRPEEKASSLTILRVDEHPVLGTIVHVSLRGLRVQAAAHPQGYTDEVRHMPFSREAIDRSVLKVVEDPAPHPELRRRTTAGRRERAGSGLSWSPTRWERSSAP